MKFVLKEINNFFDGTYYLDYEVKQITQGKRTKNITAINYTFSEELTVPKEIFIEESYYFFFSIEEYIIYSNGKEPEYAPGVSAIIYYKFDEDKVILSETCIN